MVSIIIPVYNVAEYIAQCIESCMRQTYSDLEIVIVNDGSTDRSGIIVDYYARIDSRIKVYHQRNKGVVVAREFGILKSSGEYLCFVDGDDILDLEMISRLMEKVKCSDIVSCGFYIYDDVSKCKVIRNNYYIGDDKDSIISSLFLRKCTWSLCGKIFKRSLFRGVEMPYGIKIGEDGIVCFQLHNNASKVTCVNSPLYYYRQRHSSATHNRNLTFTTSIIIFIQYVIGMIAKFHWHIDKRAMNTFLLSQIFVYYVNSGDLALLKDKINLDMSVKDVFNSDLRITERLGVILFI